MGYVSINTYWWVPLASHLTRQWCLQWCSGSNWWPEFAAVSRRIDSQTPPVAGLTGRADLPYSTSAAGCRSHRSAAELPYHPAAGWSHRKEPVPTWASATGSIDTSMHPMSHQLAGNSKNSMCVRLFTFSIHKLILQSRAYQLVKL